MKVFKVKILFNNGVTMENPNWNTNAKPLVTLDEAFRFIKKSEWFHINDSTIVRVRDITLLEIKE